MNHLLRTSNLGPALFMPWFNFDDLYALRLVCRAFNDMAALMRCLKDNIRRHLLSLFNNDQKVMDQFLELWTHKPGGANVWLTGSTLLWCLQPKSCCWEPKDMDVVLFRSPGETVSNFLPPTMEHDYTQRDEEAPDKEQYEKMLEESMCSDDNKYKIDGKRIWIRRPMRLVSGPPLVDAIFAFGDKKTSPWMHLKAFDLDFLKNAWNPQTNKLCLYGVRSLYYRTALHTRRDKDPFRKPYWKDRRDKYRTRGYKIVGPSSLSSLQELTSLEQKSEQQRADAAAEREREIAEYWVERRRKRQEDAIVFQAKRAKLSL